MKNAWTCDMLKEIAWWVQPNPNLLAHNFQHVKTYLNAWNIVKMQMECNAWSYSIKNTTSNLKISQETHQFSKTPKNFKKTQKSRSKCMKCMKNEGLRDHTKWEMHNLGWKPSGEGERVEGKVFGKGEKNFLSRRNEKEWIWLCAGPF